MKRIIVLFGILLVGAMLFACAPESVPVEKPTEVAIPVAKEGWEAEWEKTLKAAQKEGKVVIYAATTGPAIKEATPLFKKKYGITIDVLIGRGADVSRKILSERGAGLYIVDAFIGGPSNVLGEQKPAGSLDPIETALILPEVLDPKAWYGGEIPWADKDRMAISHFYYVLSSIGINTSLVKPGEIKSYSDLLQPNWKGKISVNDPTLGSGVGFVSFSTMMYYDFVSKDFWRRFVQQEPVMLADQRLQVDWLARGKQLIALWPRSVHMTEFKEAGATVASVYFLEAGTASVDGSAVGLVNRAAHPNAARIFINWYLSKEGQQLVQDVIGVQSAREDIFFAGLEPQGLRQPGVKYRPQVNQLEEWPVEMVKFEKLAREIFSPLLR